MSSVVKKVLKANEVGFIQKGACFGTECVASNLVLAFNKLRYLID
jgi:hypothetical protein